MVPQKCIPTQTRVTCRYVSDGSNLTSRKGECIWFGPPPAVLHLYFISPEKIFCIAFHAFQQINEAHSIGVLMQPFSSISAFECAQVFRIIRPIIPMLIGSQSTENFDDSRHGHRPCHSEDAFALDFWMRQCNHMQSSIILNVDEILCWCTFDRVVISIAESLDPSG